MRNLLGLALVCAGLLAPMSYLRADDRTDALAIVDNAIKAHGGADALAKAQNFTRNGSGVGFGDNKVPFTDEVTVSLPDKTRCVIDIDKKAKVILVLNGDKGWESTGATAVAANDLKVREMTDEAYVLWLTTLTPLKKEGVMLKPLPEKKVNDKPALGVSVAAKNRPDVKMYFDKESHLLVKIDREALQAGVKLDKEYLFGDYKAVDGVKLPGNLIEVINGNKFSEVKVAYKLHKPDDTAFGKP